MKRRIAPTVLLLLLITLPLPAQLARQGVYTDHTVGGGLNPTALAFTSRLWYRAPLREERGILWDPAKVDLGVRNQFSPAFEEFGAYVYWEPVAIFDLSAAVSFRRAFTAFGFGFQELESYDDSYRDLSDASDENRGGFRFTVTPRLKGAYAGFVAVNELRIDTFDFGSNVSEAGKRYFYEPVYDTVLKLRDTVVANTTILLYSLTPELRLGGQYYLRHVPGSDRTSHRFSAMGIYARPLSDGMSLFGALLAGGYAADRYRTGDLYLAGQVGLQARIWGAQAPQ